MDQPDSKQRVHNLEDKPLSQLRGLNPSDIISNLKQKARNLNRSKRHQLRQQILSDQTMAKTNTISVQLQVRHFHLDYLFQDQYEAFFLSSCHQYHTWHIKYIAQQITSNGEINCPQCKTSCTNTSKILPDALLMSLFEQSKHYSGTKVIFKRKAISNSEAKKIMVAESYNEKQTLICYERNGSENWQIVQAQIWQFVKDDRLSALSVEFLTERLNSAKNSYSQKYQKALQSIATPIVCNLVCFYSQVRIRNPLVHKDCIPQSHGGKIVLFSFEHILFDLFESQQGNNTRINCVFQSCRNYFDKNNFREVGLVLPYLHESIYSENNQNIIGLYFAGSYSSNCYLRMGQQRISKELTNSQNLREVLGQWKMRLGDLVATTSLREGTARIRKVQKKLAKKKEDSSLCNEQLEEDIYQVTLKSDNIFCPVRCFKCSNLDAIDALDLVLYLQRQQPFLKCPLCGHQFKKRQFYECFYFDSQLASFIFANGPAPKLLYDASTSSYLHHLSTFRGQALKGYLRQRQRISQQLPVAEECNIVLPQDRKFVAVADRRCIKTASTVNLMAHVVFLEQKARIRDEMVCPSCRRILRLNRLLHLQAVEMLLVLKNNNLQLLGTAITSHRQPISTLRYYKDIRQMTQPPQRTLILYFLNYQRQLIRHPLVFKGCQHPFETTICDFADIQYQLRFEEALLFKCRFRDCSRQYEYADELMRINLPVYELLTAKRSLKNQVVLKERYWLKVDLPDKISVLTEQSLQRREEEDKYRSKREFQEQKRRELEVLYKKIGEITHFRSSIEIKQQSPEAEKLDLSYELHKLNERKKQIQKVIIGPQQKTIVNPQIQSITRLYPTQSQKLASSQNKSQYKQFDRLQSKFDHTDIKTHGNLQLFNFPMAPSDIEPELIWELNSYRSS